MRTRTAARRFALVILTSSVMVLTLGWFARIAPAREVRLEAFQQDTARAPTAVMLKRIAEAVDGTVAGTSVYVVASHVPSHHVAGVFTRESDARAGARAAGRDFGVFGPYRPSMSEPNGGLPPGCVHDGVTSAVGLFICPDDMRMSDVDSLALIIRLRNGTVRTIHLPPTSDAIFLSRASVDKFVVPYYVRIVGVDSAAAMRRTWLSRRTPR